MDDQTPYQPYSKVKICDVTFVMYAFLSLYSVLEFKREAENQRRVYCLIDCWIDHGTNTVKVLFEMRIVTVYTIFMPRHKHGLH